MSEDKRQKIVAEMAAAAGLADQALIDVWRRIAATCVTEFGEIGDSGIGMGVADISFVSQGLVFDIQIKIRKQVSH